MSLAIKKIKELPVVRSPLEGKYYESTFWDRKEGNWDNEKHFVNETTPRRYVGKYLRTRSEGWVMERTIGPFSL